MPAKILLADKSITIQKVVEMLFSGRDYEVVCVSDGETALNEAARIVPDVVLADVDLPRVDGYGVAAQLRQTPLLAQTPVILMMSRDDVFDSLKGKQAGIVDNIAKPFESQELIGKVKKALAAAPARPAQPAAHPAAVPQPPSPASRPVPVQAPPSSPPPVSAKQATPSEIFDIIKEAPTESEIRKAETPARIAEEESIYEVEPEVEEVEEPIAREIANTLPTGAKAVEEIRAGLGLTGKEKEEQPDIVPFESFDLSMEPETKMEAAAQPTRPAAQSKGQPVAVPHEPTLPESELREMAEAALMKMAKEAFEKVPLPKAQVIPAEELRSMAQETISRMTEEMFAQMPPVEPPQISDDVVRRMVEEKVSDIAQEALEKAAHSKTPAVSEEELRDIAEKTISRMAQDVINNMPPPPLPKISDETVRRGLEVVLSKIAREMAREVFEQVAWEVIPPLAEQLIKEEIEKLKAMQ